MRKNSLTRLNLHRGALNHHLAINLAAIAIDNGFVDHRNYHSDLSIIRVPFGYVSPFEITDSVLEINTLKLFRSASEHILECFNVKFAVPFSDLQSLPVSSSIVKIKGDIGPFSIDPLLFEYVNLKEDPLKYIVSHIILQTPLSDLNFELSGCSQEELHEGDIITTSCYDPISYIFSPDKYSDLVIFYCIAKIEEAQRTLVWE